MGCPASPPKMEREEDLWCLSFLESSTPKMDAAIPGRWEEDEDRLARCRLRELELERDRFLCFESEYLEDECRFCCLA